MSRFLRTLPSWPNGQPLPVGGITILYDPATNLEYGLDISRLGGVGVGGGSTYEALTLTEAKARRLADPAGVVANTLYGINGRWNGLTTNTLVFVQGVKPTEYHRLGIIYDAQGVGQLVEVDVAKGTYQAQSSFVAGARILWVCGGLDFYAPQRGNQQRPYPTLQAAHDAALEGDLILVQPGGTGKDVFGRAYYTEDFLWLTDLRIVFHPGAIHGGLFQFAPFGGQNTFTKRTLIGGEFLSRVILWRQSTADCDILALNVRFAGLGNFELAGSGSYNNNFVTKAVLRGCEFDSYSPTGGFGPVRLIGRDDQGPGAIDLDNCLVVARDTEAISFRANAASRVTEFGTTEIRAAVRSKTYATVPSGFQMVESDWLVDKRQVGSGTAGTGRDPFAIGDNAAVTAAVLDLSNTWVKGDLTAYGSDALRTAGAPPAVSGQHASILIGTADVVTMDEFDKTDANGDAWRCRYSRRNNGTSGWTRIRKTT